MWRRPLLAAHLIAPTSRLVTFDGRPPLSSRQISIVGSRASHPAPADATAPRRPAMEMAANGQLPAGLALVQSFATRTQMNISINLTTIDAHVRPDCTRPAPVLSSALAIELQTKISDKAEVHLGRMQLSALLSEVAECSHSSPSRSRSLSLAVLLICNMQGTSCACAVLVMSQCYASARVKVNSLSHIGEQEKLAAGSQPCDASDYKGQRGFG